MEILIGSNTVKAKDIAQCYIEKPNESDLYLAEKRCNGRNVHYEEIVPTLTDKINFDLIAKYTHPIAHVLVYELPIVLQKNCPMNIEFHLPFSFSVGTKYNPPRYGVVWTYWAGGAEDTGNKVFNEHIQMLHATDLLPAIDWLVNALKFQRKRNPLERENPLHYHLYNTFPLLFKEFYLKGHFKGRLIADPSVLQDFETLRQQLAEAKIAEDELALRVQERDAIRQAFFQENAETPVLTIIQRNNYRMSFMENKCGFDIYEKKAEIDAAIAEARKQYLEVKKRRAEEEKRQAAQAEHEAKLRRSYNRGEKVVKYDIKWLLSTNSDTIFSISGDCETNSRYNTILLRNPILGNISQRFEHLLVTPAGIITILTNNWREHTLIQPDGKWIRSTEGGEICAEGPQTKIARCETFLNGILPGVPIHSIYCFTNRSVIVDGAENFTACPIVMLEGLSNHIIKICETKTYSVEEMKQMVDIIESCKFNRQPEVYDCTPSHINANNSNDKSK